MTQQYSTPDGSVWTSGKPEPNFELRFTRISGPGADMDFRPQKLDEVLRHWGPLSLYDPVHAAAEALDLALSKCGLALRNKTASHSLEGARHLIGPINQLASDGWLITRKEDD